MGRGKKVVTAKYKRLVVPRPNYEQSGYQQPLNGHYIFADGSQYNGVASINKDYGIALSTPDIRFSNKITSLDIRHRFNNDYAIPSANITEVLDLSELKHLETINFRSPFLLGDNIIFPEIVAPLVSIDTNNNLSGYSSQNSVTGILDLTPLNSNGMFGGDVYISLTSLDDIILPINVTREIDLTLGIGDGTTGLWDLSTYTRLGGLFCTAGTKSGVIFPTLQEPDAPICGLNFNSGNGLDNTVDKVFDLSAMHNLGGTIDLNNLEIGYITFNSNIVNEVTRLRLYNNRTQTLNLSGFKNFNGRLDIRNQSNGGLTSITLPPNATTTYTTLDIGANTSLNLGTLDLTGASFNDCNLQLNDIGLTSAPIIDTAQKQNVKILNIQLNPIVGILDLSGYTNPLGVSLLVGDSSDTITSIILGANILESNTGFRFSPNITSLDFSTCTFKDGAFRASEMASLTTITFPTTYLARPTFMYLYGTAINHTLDFSDINKLPTSQLNAYSITGDFDILFPVDGTDAEISQSIRVSTTSSINYVVLNLAGFKYLPPTRTENSTNLNSIIFKTGGYIDTRSSRPNNFWVDNCPVLAPPDFSVFTGLNTLHSSIRVYDCNWSTSEVNKVLVDIASIEALHNYGSGTLNISGSNSAPDGTSGGYDGTTALTALTTAGWTVTVSTEVIQSFNFTVQTTVTSEAFTLPLKSGSTYNFTADFGDGNRKLVTTDSYTHTYDIAGTYTIKIFSVGNSGLPDFVFDDTGDKDKILSVDQWGTNEFEELNFNGCSNLTTLPSGVPDLTTNSVSKVNMFRNTDVDIDFNGWDFTYDTDLTGFLEGVKLSDANYESLLNYLNTNKNSLATIIDADFGLSELTATAFEYKKNISYAPSLWTIFDGGFNSTVYVPQSGDDYVSFDGVSQYGTIDDLTIGDNTSDILDYHIVFRHTMTTAPTAAFGIAGKNIFGAADRYSLHFTNNSGVVLRGQLQMGSGGNNIDAIGSWGNTNDGNWHRVDFSKSDIGRFRIYIDGKEEGRGVDFDTATFTTKFFIAAYGNGTGTSPESGTYSDFEMSELVVDNETWDVTEGTGSTLTSNENSKTISLFNSPTWGTV